MMKKAVVVGGSGFLGSHVADHLTSAGYQVTIYDKTKSQWLQSEQEMVVGDVLDSDKLNQSIIGADVVYNFAALADLNQAFEAPIKTVNINILGNLNVMEACQAYDVKRFIYASTVYVHSLEGGFYRCSKQASEAYVEEYQKIYGLDYTILRYGSLYGPRADKTNGLYRIIKYALESGIVKYQGDVNAMREYIHVDDAARASVDAINGEFRNESVVLTGQEPMKVIDMLKILSEILGLSTDSVVFVEEKYAGHYVRTPYSYQPKLGRKYIPPMHVDLGQGLLQVINDISAKSSS
jgi:UDP-glucose 4-epimerase